MQRKGAERTEIPYFCYKSRLGCDGKKIFIKKTSDSSTKTYINSDVAEQQKLKGIPKQVTAKLKHLKRYLWKINLYEKLKQKLSACTTDRVTDKWKNKWKYFKKTNFPALGRRSMVGIFIGMDYSELHFQ